MLQIKNLSITHKKDLREILQDFSCVLNAGDKAVIIGEEGNGKSTLLKLIYDPSLVENYIEYSGTISAQDDRIGYLAQMACFTFSAASFETSARISSRENSSDAPAARAVMILPSRTTAAFTQFAP